MLQVSCTKQYQHCMHHNVWEVLSAGPKECCIKDSALSLDLCFCSTPSPCIWPGLLLSLSQMLLHLFSDANYNLLGFNATYSFSVCPGACSGHGRCDTLSARCLCPEGWGGGDCSSRLCPHVCPLHGSCDKVGQPHSSFYCFFCPFTSGHSPLLSHSPKDAVNPINNEEVENMLNYEQIGHKDMLLCVEVLTSPLCPHPSY